MVSREDVQNIVIFGYLTEEMVNKLSSQQRELFCDYESLSLNMQARLLKGEFSLEHRGIALLTLAHFFDQPNPPDRCLPKNEVSMTGENYEDPT